MYGDHQCLHVLTHSFPTRLSSDLAGGDHAADAIVEQRPGGMLARRAAAEIVAGDQDLRALVLRLVHEEFRHRSEEHTSELQSLMRISYAVFCLKKKTNQQTRTPHRTMNQRTNTPTSRSRQM